jgi:hypothetical protein
VGTRRLRDFLGRLAMTAAAAGQGALNCSPASRALSYCRRGERMEVAYISALSALAGSIIGGLTSGFANWLVQRSQAQAEQLTRDRTRRTELYKDFIIEASKVYAGAVMSNEPDIEELIALYGMISRMRTMSSSAIVTCAERILVETTTAYSQPNQTLPELTELLKSGTGIDPLKDFAEAVRAEFGLN